MRALGFKQGTIVKRAGEEEREGRHIYGCSREEKPATYSLQPHLFQ